MSIELTPLGVKCNLKCTYCYQNPMRDAGNENASLYDLELMMRAAEAEGVGQPDGAGGRTGFAVFGGEPLLVPKPDLRRLFQFGKDKGVPVGIQTNATLMDDDHVAMFREFAVGVGVSIDGPGELNDTRWNGNLESTRALTARSQAAIERLLDEGVSVSLIVTLNDTNAGDDGKLARLRDWVVALRDRGLRWLNLHELEVDGPAADALRLGPGRLAAALRALDIPGMSVAPLEAFRKLLLGDDRRDVNCIWHACDPWTTAAVRGIDGVGNRGNCGRTNKDGVLWVKADAAGHERQLALFLTPQEHGGCAGCRFFFACKGECPGTAEAGDWRTRTEHCPALMAMFEEAEARLAREGLEPISCSLRRPLVEARLLEAWQAGRNISIAEALVGWPASGLGAAAHGDVGHGDVAHGDHTDAARPVVTHGDSGR
jgi:uncharacterized protein